MALTVHFPSATWFSSRRSASKVRTTFQPRDSRVEQSISSRKKLIRGAENPTHNRDFLLCRKNGEVSEANSATSLAGSVDRLSPRLPKEAVSAPIYEELAGARAVAEDKVYAR